MNVSGKPVKNQVEIPTERPEWIKVRGVQAEVQASMKKILSGCNTVCLSAKCPNLGECFERGVATFMIGGAVCTRACRFCGVKHGKPEPLDPEEPKHVAESAKSLGLRYLVITSVARDDLDDGGAGHFASTVREIHTLVPDTGIEVLIPDFSGSDEALKIVLDSKPQVLNHNIETVRRLAPVVRSRAEYDRSLGVLRSSRRIAPDIPTKSGLMVGLGESWDEVVETLGDMHETGCEIVTIGQYLQPRAGEELPVARYWTPDEFDEIKWAARKIGFKAVASGPFVRSSYFAEDLAVMARS
jgi:lipoic acid synthetase